MFRTKREGVAFVLDAIEAAFPAAVVRVFTVEGRFLTEDEARRDPLAVGAANWAATARVVAWHHPDAVLIDIGTTSTDIIPIAGGTVGRDRTYRPGSTGVRRAGVHGSRADAGRGDREPGALSWRVRRRLGRRLRPGGRCPRLARDSFAGRLHIADTRRSPGHARVCRGTPRASGLRRSRNAGRSWDLCDRRRAGRRADRAGGEAIRRVAARHRSLRTAVVTGLGAFLASAAARAAELEVMPLSSEIGDAAARCAPAASVALLLERELTGPAGRSRPLLRYAAFARTSRPW